jgi:hypothetical protein
MDKEIKTSWIVALRSGEYKKGTGRLYDQVNDTYCCIGVLGCIVNKDKGYTGAHGHTKNWRSGYLIAREEIGSVNMDKLTNMNDGDTAMDLEPRTFDEIADYIETNF